MEHWWNNTDSRYQNYSQENLSQLQFVHQESHTKYFGTEPRPPKWQAGDELPEPWHNRRIIFNAQKLGI